MLQTTVVALVLGFWASLYLIDGFLKGHERYSQYYLQFLDRTGITVSMAQIRYYTQCCNRIFMRIGQWRPHFWRYWFNAGVVFGVIAMLASVVLLVLTVKKTLQSAPAEERILTPVLPGVNLPSNQIAYYLLTLLVCGILHEVGHAVAAAREQVKVNGFGLFVLAIYPGAYVDLCTEHLQGISPIRQLRIYCAGVWHNFIIVIFAIGVLVLLPWLLMPLYSVGDGIVITHVTENSVVSGPRGLQVGDEVTGLSNCPVRNVREWIRCIHLATQEKSSGYCMPMDLLKQQDISYFIHPTPMGSVECCQNTSNTHLCFSYHQKASSELKYACLPARSTVERQSCHLQSDCYNPTTPSVCVTPSLDNSTKLLRVFHKRRAPLLFLGHPLDLHYAVILSDFVPSTLFAPVNLPYAIEMFCKYLISLSGALAILNVVPCYALDGQWILLSLVEWTLRSSIRDPETRGLLYTVILLLGTLLLGINLLLAMWSLVFR